MRLLVNWVTHPLVGMTVEGLRWVNAFRAENPALEIGLLLHARCADSAGRMPAGAGPSVYRRCRRHLQR